MLEYKHLQDVLFQCDASLLYNLYASGIRFPEDTILGHRSSFDTTNICTHWDEANPDVLYNLMRTIREKKTYLKHIRLLPTMHKLSKSSFFDSATRLHEFMMTSVLLFFGKNQLQSQQFERIHLKKQHRINLTSAKWRFQGGGFSPTHLKNMAHVKIGSFPQGSG